MAFTVQYEVREGTTPYTVTLTGSGLQPKVHSIDGTYTFVNVPAGTYTLDAVDGAGCESTLSVILVATTTTTTTPPATCNLTDFTWTPTNSLQGESTGSLTITSVSGDQGTLTYQLNGGTPQTSNVFNNLAADLYTVTVIDAFVPSCTISKDVWVFETIELPAFNISLENIQTPEYFGTADGSQSNPYPNNIVVDFNVVGNGGTGFTSPAVYYFQVTCIGSLLQVEYRGNAYDCGNLLTQGNGALVPPRGELTLANQIDSFSGGIANHSFSLQNISLKNAAAVGLTLYRNGVAKQSPISFWIDAGGGFTL